MSIVRIHLSFFSPAWKTKHCFCFRICYFKFLKNIHISLWDTLIYEPSKNAEYFLYRICLWIFNLPFELFIYLLFNLPLLRIMAPCLLKIQDLIVCSPVGCNPDVGHFLYSYIFICIFAFSSTSPALFTLSPCVCMNRAVLPCPHAVRTDRINNGGGRYCRPTAKQTLPVALLSHCQANWWALCFFSYFFPNKLLWFGTAERTKYSETVFQFYLW